MEASLISTSLGRCGYGIGKIVTSATYAVRSGINALHCFISGLGYLDQLDVRPVQHYVNSKQGSQPSLSLEHFCRVL